MTFEVLCVINLIPSLCSPTVPLTPRLVSAMVFYGLSLNSGNLAGNIYVNFELMGVVEIIAYCICLVGLNRLGRKVIHITCMVVGGGACLSTIFTVLYANECEYNN